ncbi:hypothetical protein BJY01DRAFT_215221 [Aspergillus pseudoustus]|uniref:Mitochondrial inner-membrane-bound regulator-domain-containing protein n=1 Tax=Aspergillus pseudoustus TaxID=1810923 RepID=A0ABR4JVS5_9EURO
MQRCRSLLLGAPRGINAWSAPRARMSSSIANKQSQPLLEMPGFNEPLNFEPNHNAVDRYSVNGFPNALDPEHIDGGYLDKLVTHREITMMRIMNAITDKRDWDKKVWDDKITAKWRAELLHRSGQDVSERMLNWIIQELRWKASRLPQNQFVEVFDDGVVKSDTAVPQELRARLQSAVAPLEDVPAGAKDYHPNSGDTVVDLVHPSLFPVIYGRTRVLPDRVLGLDDCLDSIGQGEVVPIPPQDDAKPILSPNYQSDYFSRYSNPPEYSTKFQWLPCEVELSETKECRIVSYINNAHPVAHRALYEAVEKILARTIPLWEKSLTRQPFEGGRIQYKRVEYEPDTEPEPEYPEDPGEDFDEGAHFEEYDAWFSRRRIKQPEPPTRFQVKDSWEEDVDFTKHFPNQNLQVIVKLANIELTPEKPHYEGGTWHIEGQLNERIAASAIYYYDNKNITPSSLAFRHRGMDDFYDFYYEQSQHEFLQQVYGFPDTVDGHNQGLVTQELGSVECREGRLITFPNTLQHRVSPFSLADPSKPGHRKILALFLVDPHRRVISSANVPPQKEGWRRDGQKDASSGQKGLMSMEEAKGYRLELMKERGMRAEHSDYLYQEGNFGLCEH